MPTYYSRSPADLGADATCSGLECTLASAIDGLFPYILLGAIALVAVALAYVPLARDRCAEERRYTRAEIRAFDRFARRVADLEAVSPPAATAPMTDDGPATATLASPPPDPGVRAVRRSYRETIMAVPHYEAEYDEPLDENVAGEFDPRIATALAEGGRLTPGLKRAVVGSAVSARDRRRRLLETVDAESESLESIERTFRSVETTLEELNERPLSDYSFDGLVDAWERLEGLEGRLERTIADREAEIQTGENLGRGIPGPWSTYAYLYEPLSVRFPALHDGALLASDVASAKRATLRALANRA